MNDKQPRHFRPALSMEIRAAVPADASAIAKVHVTSEQAAYGGIIPDDVLGALSVEKQESRWRERIQSSASTTLVAHQNDVVLGWINVGKSRDSDAPARTGEIRAMYVAPEKWRCGIGTALWQHAKDFLREAGYSEVTLWVLEANHRARHFYEKSGFHLETGIRKTLERGSKTVSEVRYRINL